MVSSDFSRYQDNASPKFFRVRKNRMAVIQSMIFFNAVTFERSGTNAIVLKTAFPDKVLYRCLGEMEKVLFPLRSEKKAAVSCPLPAGTGNT